MDGSSTTPAIAGRTATPRREAVGSHIADEAMRLFGERGFEETTAEAIAEAAGVSRRTFFRYFPSKGDVVVGLLDEVGPRLRDALAARPADEDPWTALRNAIDPVLDRLRTDPEVALAIQRLLARTPTLRAAKLDEQQAWQVALAEELRERGDVGPPAKMRSMLLAAASLAAMEVAVDAWADADGQADIDLLLDQAFATLGAGLGAGRR
jgi:AcrR family transcriptional regulator